MLIFKARKELSMNTNPVTIKKLIADLSSSDDFTRLKARRELQETGKPAYTSLLEALRDRNCLVRWEAVNVLGGTGDPEVAPVLVSALEDSEFEVRWVAAEALVRMGTKGLKALLQGLIERADSAFLRERAHHVLHKLATGELKVFLTPLLIALESREPSIELPPVALHAIETMDEALNPVRKIDPSSPLYSILAVPTKMNPDLSARKRSQRYVRSLQKEQSPADQDFARA
jgi:HEAT repeat protein